jgi:phage-related protein
VADFEVAGEASLDPDRLIEDVGAIIDKLDELEAKLDEISTKVDELSNKGIDLKVVIDGQDKLDELSLLLDEMDSHDYVLTIRVNIDGQDKLDELEIKLAAMDKMPHDVTETVKVDGLADSEAKLAAFNSTADDTKKKLDAAGKSASGFSFSMGLLAPLLMPISAGLLSAAGGAMGLAASLGAVAVPALAFGYSLKTAFTNASTLVGSLTAAQQAALASDTTFGQVTATLDKSSVAYQNMNSFMRNIVTEYVLMKNAITQFQNAIQPQVAVAMYDILQLLKVVLTDLTPAVQAFGTAFDGVLGYLLAKLQDPTFQKFFSDATKAIGTLVKNWGDGVVNIIEGITALLDAFLPLGVSMSGGFLKMTQEFDTWAQHLGESAGFKKFVSTVATDGPILLNILGQVILLIGHLVGALGESSGNTGFLKFLDDVLKTLNKFLGTHQGLTTVAADLGLMALAASKLGPLLGPLSAFLMTPVGAVVGAIALLAIGFGLLYKNSKTFHDWVNANLLPMFKTLGTDATQMKDFFVKIWPEIQAVWEKYGSNIIKIVTGDFQAVVGIIGGVMKMIEGIIEIALGLLTGNWSMVWKGIKDLFSGFWNAIFALAKGALNLLVQEFIMQFKYMAGLWDSAWRGISSAFSNQLKQIELFLGQATSWLTSHVEQWGKDFVNAFVTAGVNVINFFTGLPGKIISALGNLGNLLINAGMSLIQGFINGIENMFSGVQSTLGSLTSLLTSWKGPPEKDKTLLVSSGQMVIQGFIDGLESKYSAVHSSLGGLTNGIADKFGSQFTTDISAKMNASMNSQLGSQSIGAGGNLNGGGGSVTIASGAITINNPTPEPASQSLTKMLQSTAAFGILQAPAGAMFPGG